MPTYNKKYYQEHREQKLAYQKEYREKHPEYHAEWQRKNKEKLKAIKTRYRKKLALHKKRVKQAKLQYRDSKGRFCKWEDKYIDFTIAFRNNRRNNHTSN